VIKIIKKECRQLLKESAAARKMIVYGGVGGALYSLTQFGEVIARKSLGATGLEVTLLSMSMPITQLTSMWWGKILTGRDQRRVLWIIGMAGILAVATGAVMETYAHLLTIFVIFFMSMALLATAQNRIFQQHIPNKQMGGLFGLSQGLRMGISAAAAAGIGWWLEYMDKGWQQLFPAAALTGVISLWAIAAIPTGEEGQAAPLHWRYWLLGPLKETSALLKRRPDFLRFENAFMVYGAAFMMTLPVVPIFLVDDLQLSYSEIGMTRGAAFQLIMLAGIPFFGRIFDRSTPHRMSAIAFSILTLYPAVLLSAKYVTGEFRFILVMLAFLIFGFALSSVHVVWNLASIRFTGPGEDAGEFQAVHIAATGIRGMMAPLLGYLIMSWFGREIALVCASIVWILSAGAMIWARQVDRKRGEAYSLRASG